MSFLKFPSPEEWSKIHQRTPRLLFNQKFRYLIESLNLNGEVVGFSRSLEIREFIWQLHYRLVDAVKCYVMMSFYFELGIPDDEWFISPGQDNSSVQYFPHFNEDHFAIKDWFDFYSDAFYYKLFSAWDIVGHLLNAKLKLDIPSDSVTFSRTVHKIKNRFDDLWSQLNEILISPAYQLAKRLRNDITHNFLPGSAGLSINREFEEGALKIGIGLREYVTSKEIMSNSDEILELFHKTFDIISFRKGN